MSRAFFFILTAFDISLHIFGAQKIVLQLYPIQLDFQESNICIRNLRKKEGISYTTLA